jgi:hypothetical protein
MAELKLQCAQKHIHMWGPYLPDVMDLSFHN